MFLEFDFVVGPFYKKNNPILTFDFLHSGQKVFFWRKNKRKLIWATSIFLSFYLKLDILPGQKANFGHTKAI